MIGLSLSGQTVWYSIIFLSTIKLNIMKTLNIFLSLFFLATTFSVNAQKAPAAGLKKETVKVWGECGMCKNTIEKSAKEAGATVANWNTETKVLTVSYNAKKTDTKKIQQAIAAAGYDTRDIAASKEAYDKLHECCKYERKEVSATVKEKGACCEDGKEGACCKDDKEGHEKKHQ